LQEGVEVTSKENGQTRLNLKDLKPAMKLEGRVTKTELMGAFVDVGAECDGLIHISKLKEGQVNRVEDIVEVGQEVEVWVHRVDSKSGRLELSMLKPILLKWNDIKTGARLKGKIIRIENFGAFVDVGAERPGLVHISELSNDYVNNPNEIVSIGDEVEVNVIEVDRKKRQIRFSMKDSISNYIDEDDEPEEETPTAMELALRQALEQSDQKPAKSTDQAASKKQGKRDELEDILNRTLERRVQTASTES
jgi:transcriptional accessory protein Tex/SPT6